MKEHLLVTRYDPNRVERGEMLKLEDVREILAIPLLGVIPENRERAARLEHRHAGDPRHESIAGQAYKDAVARFLGEELPHRFLEPDKKPGLLQSPVRGEGCLMSWLDYFRANRKPEPPSATQAKERLQIVLAHERIGRTREDFLPRLQQDLVAVVARYVAIDPGKVNVALDRGGDISTLAIEIELPGARPAPAGAAARA